MSAAIRTEIFTQNDIRGVESALHYDLAQGFSTEGNNIRRFERFLRSGGTLHIKTDEYDFVTNSASEYVAFVLGVFPGQNWLFKEREASLDLRKTEAEAITLEKYRTHHAKTYTPEYKLYTRPQKVETGLGDWTIQAEIETTEIIASGITQGDIEKACDIFAARVKADEENVYRRLSAHYKSWVASGATGKEHLGTTQAVENADRETLARSLDLLYVFVSHANSEFFAHLSLRPTWSKRQGPFFEHVNGAWKLAF